MGVSRFGSRDAVTRLWGGGEWGWWCEAEHISNTHALVTGSRKARACVHVPGGEGGCVRGVRGVECRGRCLARHEWEERAKLKHSSFVLGVATGNCQKRSQKLQHLYLYHIIICVIFIICDRLHAEINGRLAAKVCIG